MINHAVVYKLLQGYCVKNLLMHFSNQVVTINRVKDASSVNTVTFSSIFCFRIVAKKTHGKNQI